MSVCQTFRIHIKQHILFSIADESNLRFYLRGRALNFYTPSNLCDYSATSVTELPEQKLKLEWVYPCSISVYWDIIMCFII